MLSSYFLSLFWTRYTLVVDAVPQLEPVMVIDDFRIGDDEVFDREVIWGAIAGLQLNMNWVDYPLYKIMLLVPEHVSTCLGTMNLIYLLDIRVNFETVFPHTCTDSPDDELIGNPEPAMVAYIPPPGLVYAGLNEDIEIVTV